MRTNYKFVQPFVSCRERERKNTKLTLCCESGSTETKSTLFAALLAQKWKFTFEHADWSIQGWEVYVDSCEDRWEQH